MDGAAAANGRRAPDGGGDVQATLGGACRRILCSPDSPIFFGVGWFLDTGHWYRLSGVIAAGVIAHTLVALAAAPALGAEGSLTFGAVGVGCALANVAAFASYRPQVRGLIGAEGLAPATEVLRRLKRVPFRRAPTVFRFCGHCSDRALLGACDVGLSCSLLLVFAQLGPRLLRAAAPVLWLAAGWLYLSLLMVSGDFLGLQSDSNLVEVDALLAVLSMLTPWRPQVAVIAVRFFAFRKMLGCGVCKYYGSPMWREFTALQVHYFTQPLVNPRSIVAHRFSEAFHRFSVLATFVVEVALPFCAWGPRPLRLFAWMGFNGLNGMINASGNYGFIGFLNTAENLSLMDDGVWVALFPGAALAPEAASAEASAAGSSAASGLVAAVATAAAAFVRLALGGVVSCYIALSLLPLARAAKGDVGLATLGAPASVSAAMSRLHDAQAPFRLVNYQGKFAGMHTFRWEPILEGSADGGATWRQFRWRYKLNMGPQERGVALWLHLPRLDWRVWFLPLAASRGREPPSWYYRLVEKLVEQDPVVLGLLAENPFHSADGAPPPDLIARSRLVSCQIAPAAAAAAAGSAGWVFEPLRRETPMDFNVRSSAPPPSSPLGRPESPSAKRRRAPS